MNGVSQTVVHLAVEEYGLTVCCGRTSFELPWTDALTNDVGLVTCKPYTTEKSAWNEEFTELERQVHVAAMIVVRDEPE